MRFFDYKKIAGKSWDSELLGLVGAIYKEAGKQELYLKQSLMVFKISLTCSKIKVKFIVLSSC